MSRRMLTVILCFLSIVAFLLISPCVFAGSFMEKFIDPKDGKFDASDWLLKQKGFLPVPIIITEPAVGYGGGAGLMFFHESIDDQIARQQTESQDKKTMARKIDCSLPAFRASGV
jgi:hypothetical protein